MLKSLGLSCAVFCAVIGIPATASADISSPPAWGLTFFGQGYACTSSCDNASGNGINNTDDENLQQLSLSNSFALSSAIPGSSSTSAFSGSISGTELHAFSATADTGPLGAGYNGEDEYWFDTFSFSGCTLNSPCKATINLVFDGTLTRSGSSIYDLVDNFQFFENGTVIPGEEYLGNVATLYPASTQSVQLTFDSPTSIVLGGLLQIRNYIGFDTSITIDDSDTAYFTVTSTGGGGFTTASGQTYSVTPEPGYWALLSVAIVGLIWVKKRRARAES